MSPAHSLCINLSFHRTKRMAIAHTTIRSSARPPILVVGVEQEWAARSLDTVLSPHGFALVRGHSGRHTVELASSVSPDVVLIDSRLSDVDGLDVCRILRTEQRVGTHVPIVLMTSGAAPRDFLREAYLAGAWSVWEQPLDGELLVLRLRTWVDAKRVVDGADRVRLLDAESGLYTCRGLHHRVREMLADAVRRQTPLSCIAVGAVAVTDDAESADRPLPPQVCGDVGRALAAVPRGSDVVGQLGSSEFAILTPMTEQDGASRMVARIRSRVAELPAFREAGQQFRIGVRAGVATIAPPTPSDASGTDLLVRASTALRFAHASRALSVPGFDEVPASFV